MPLPSNYYTSAEALDLLTKKLPDEDPKESLLQALRDGSIVATLIDEKTGKSIEIPREKWWPSGNRGFRHFLHISTASYTRDVMDMLSGGMVGYSGEIRFDKDAFDALLANAAPAADSELAQETHVGTRRRGRRPNSETDEDAFWKEFDALKEAGFTFKRGELANIAKTIGAKTGLEANTVEKKIRKDYWAGQPNPNTA